MKSFVLNKSGEYFGDFAEGDDFSKNNLTQKLTKEILYLSKEIEERDAAGNIKRILAEAPIKTDDPAYFHALNARLKKDGFLVYVFDGERRRVAELLVKAPLKNEERLEFFNNLLSVPEKEAAELARGIEEDLSF